MSSPKKPALIWMAVLWLAAAAFPAAASAFDIGIYLLAVLAVSGGLFAFVYLATRSPVVFIAPLLTFAASIAVSHSVLSSLAACSFVIPGFVLALTLSKKYDRTQSVIAVSAALCVSYLLYTVIKVALTYGGLGASAFSEFYEAETDAIRLTLNTVLASGSSDGDGSRVEYLVNYMLVMLPGDLICVMNITAYLVSLAFICPAKLFRVDKIVAPSPWRVELSVVSACFFVGTYLFAVLGQNIAVISAVTTNLIMVLTPGFALVGLESIIARCRTPRGRSAAVLYGVAAVILFLLNPLTIFLLAAFVGVFETFAKRRRLRSVDSDGSGS